MVAFDTCRIVHLWETLNRNVLIIVKYLLIKTDIYFKFSSCYMSLLYIHLINFGGSFEDYFLNYQFKFAERIILSI